MAQRGRKKVQKTEDGFIDARKYKVIQEGGQVPSILNRKEDGVTTICRNASLLGDIVADVFTSPNGSSWYRDPVTNQARPLPYYESPEQLIEAIELWEKATAERIANGDEIIPDAEALAVGIGVSMSTIRDWKKGMRGSAFKNIINFELDKIGAVKNQLAMKGAIPPIVWMGMMNARHGYATAQKTDYDVDTSARENISETELIERARLLP